MECMMANIKLQFKTVSWGIPKFFKYGNAKLKKLDTTYSNGSNLKLHMNATSNIENQISPARNLF